jgi:hypothetical protein
MSLNDFWPKKNENLINFFIGPTLLTHYEKNSDTKN